MADRNPYIPSERVQDVQERSSDIEDKAKQRYDDEQAQLREEAITANKRFDKAEEKEKVPAD
ncbi:MAG TPA: hypothetical protein VGK19_03385 [Capsulimonadaceae bacterium]|jgi:hypothetical protein